jgi:hypothetical protein
MNATIGENKSSIEQDLEVGAEVRIPQIIDQNA